MIVVRGAFAPSVDRFSQHTLTLPAMTDLRAFPNFKSAAEAVLKLLYDRTGFHLWMVTRTEGDDWIVLDALDHGYGVEAGRVFRWADSFCKRMVAGEGPRVAPAAQQVPAYAEAAICDQVPIGAYVGVPLTRADGTLFGTLCGIHPETHDDKLHCELPLAEMLARLLSSLLVAEMEALQQSRRAERAEAELLTDSLTGLYNRRGWDTLLAAEESRCQRYGSNACVLTVDLDELKRINDTRGHSQGDLLIQAAARAIEHSTREQDVVARVGGDEFCIMAVECDLTGGQALYERLTRQFRREGIKASVGLAPRTVQGSLIEAWRASDEAMYAHKRRQVVQADM
jgi:diguanylate cyclase (GGDEF)-like protein